MDKAKKRDFQGRISYEGELQLVLERVCNDYKVGIFKKFTIVTIGYEDLNIILYTSQGVFFVKIFASSRDEFECKQYVEIIQTAVQAGVAHPQIYASSQGFLYKLLLEGSIIFLCVMDYINGQNFQELNKKPSKTEMKYIIHQAALINKINLHPIPVYDSWAIPNFLQEYEIKKYALKKDDDALLTPLISVYESLNIVDLPHCFIHGDIIATNTMQDKKGNIYIIDFAVVNYYPRIQELAVLLCDLFYIPNNPTFLLDTYNLVINTYQEYIPLTEKEIKSIPAYIKLAHGMHLLRANYEKVVNGNQSSENEYFLTIGRLGLEETKTLQ